MNLFIIFEDILIIFNLRSIKIVYSQTIRRSNPFNFLHIGENLILPLISNSIVAFPLSVLLSSSDEFPISRYGKVKLSLVAGIFLLDYRIHRMLLFFAQKRSVLCNSIREGATILMKNEVELLDSSYFLQICFLALEGTGICIDIVHATYY